MFTWTITSMDRTLAEGDLSDVVTTLHFECTDSETVGEVTHNGRVYGTVGLAEPSDSFTPYADITEEQAIGWCKAALGDDQVTAYETSVDNQISLEKNPTTGTGFPR